MVGMAFGKPGAVIKKKESPNGYIGYLNTNGVNLKFQIKKWVLKFKALSANYLGPLGDVIGAINISGKRFKRDQQN